MGTFNNAILLGRLGRDPETRFTNSGKQVCDFSLATDRKSQGESLTDWHKIVCWDKTAEIAAKFLKKGSEVQVQGDIRYGSYQKDGVEIRTTEINCRQITLVGKKEGGGGGSVNGGTDSGSGKGASTPF